MPFHGTSSNETNLIAQIIFDFTFSIAEFLAKVRDGKKGAHFGPPGNDAVKSSQKLPARGVP
jgi:hypothetical protein